MVYPSIHQSLILILVLQGAVGCARSGTLEFVPEQKVAEVSIDDSDIDYLLIQREVIGPSCIHCHSTASTHPRKSKPYFDSYDEVKVKIDRILHRITKTPMKPMPPSDSDYPKPDSSRIHLVSRWKELGLVEDRSQTRPVEPPTTPTEPPTTPTEPPTTPTEPPTTPTEPPPPTEPTPEPINFVTVNEKLFKPYSCLECHSFDQYAEAKSAADEILKRITIRGSGAMPETCAEDETTCVKEEAVQHFKNWIDLGLPEN